MAELPIDEILEDVARVVTSKGVLVLQAPPGAGKTTRVPLHLLDAVEGRILVLEPRRVAARSAATHMAGLLGEAVGERVGYRMRGEAKVGRSTRIEVVTEGILTRMIQSDPELAGVGCVIFDEFHERSLQADLGLALALEIRAALRPDLKLIVMSATLDAEPVAKMMGAEVLTSHGRSFDVSMEWLDRPWGRPGRGRRGFELALAGLVERAVAETDAGVLVFCPGAGEIARLAGVLDLGAGVEVVQLYGALPFKEQMRALEPVTMGRKVVLATSIAETSLTIPDVRAVVDGGLARRPRFDPNSGMTRLVTEKVTKAEAVQRAGRAGRVAAGKCYRLWTKGEEAGFAPFPPVEIEDSDLLGLALDLAAWGARDADDLAFLTPPPEGAMVEARALLRGFGALTDEGAITAYGRKLAGMPLHPRLAHMVARGREVGMGWTAPALAALIEGRGLSRSDADLGLDIRKLKAGDASRDVKQALKRIRAGRDEGDLSVGAVASLAYPDRIGQRRPGDAPRYLLSGGKGAVLTGDLGASPWLVVCDLDGDPREARIHKAAIVAEEELRELYEITAGDVCFWDKRKSAVVAERQERLGALVLDAKAGKGDPEQARLAMIEGIRQMGLAALPWNKASRQFAARVEWARAHGSDFADMSDAGLLAELETWLGPYLDGVATKKALSGVDLGAALEARLGWDDMQKLGQVAPQKFKAPTGTGVAIDYGGEVPKISIRLQELMGLTAHPTVGADRIALKVELLSPAQRPIQTTSDLPGFWATSYADVRKDMRGRYPRHHWPENPAEAEPTRRVKDHRPG